LPCCHGIRYCERNEVSEKPTPNAQSSVERDNSVENILTCIYSFISLVAGHNITILLPSKSTLSDYLKFFWSTSLIKKTTIMSIKHISIFTTDFCSSWNRLQILGLEPESSSLLLRCGTVADPEHGSRVLLLRRGKDSQTSVLLALGSVYTFANPSKNQRTSPHTIC
jgi:hypothetical protein